MQGDLYDHQSLVSAIKQVDVVISTVGHLQLADQDKIISAIKEAGNVKVYFFSLPFGVCIPFKFWSGALVVILCCTEIYILAMIVMFILFVNVLNKKIGNNKCVNKIVQIS